MKVDLPNISNLDNENVYDTFSNSTGSSCRKPLVPDIYVNRNKWKEYRDCLVREEKQRQQDAIDREKQRQFELEQAKIKAEQKKAEIKAQSERDSLIAQQLNLKAQQRQMEQSGKFLGMPIPLAIGLGVLLLGGISFGIYKLVKK